MYTHKNKFVITNKILLLVENYSYQNYRTNIFEITLAYATPLTFLSFNRIMNWHSTNHRYEFAFYNQHVINNRRFRFETKESNRKFNIRHQFAHNGFHMLLTSNKQSCLITGCGTSRRSFAVCCGIQTAALSHSYVIELCLFHVLQP